MKTAKKYTILFIVAVSLMVTGLSSCLNDLDTIPLDPEELVSEVVFGSEIGPYQSYWRRSMPEWPSAATAVEMAIPM